MTVSKFMTPARLFEYLDEEIDGALKKSEVWRLFDYGWKNEDDPDPKYIGLCKWSVDGLNLMFPGRSGDDFYTADRYEVLLTLCSDLESLMEVSRLAIGNALWMSDKAKSDIFDHHHHFWLNQISSVTLLNMVSDRIRDLFLLIVFGETLPEYKAARRGRNIGELQPNHFQYAFHDATSLSKMQPCAAQLETLQRLTEAIWVKRSDRNSTVHEVATQAGHLTKKWFSANQAETAARLNSNFQVVSDVHQKAKSMHEQTIDSALDSSVTFYKYLVLATSQIFDIEHTLRTGR